MSLCSCCYVAIMSCQDIHTGNIITYVYFVMTLMWSRLMLFWANSKVTTFSYLGNTESMLILNFIMVKFIFFLSRNHCRQKMNYVSHKELFIYSVLTDRCLELVASLISIFRFVHIPIKFIFFCIYWCSSPLHLHRWLLRRGCTGSRNFLDAFRKAVENEEEKAHGVGK